MLCYREVLEFPTVPANKVARCCNMLRQTNSSIGASTVVLAQQPHLLRVQGAAWLVAAAASCADAPGALGRDGAAAAAAAAA
jgi:hypothetical protein